MIRRNLSLLIALAAAIPALAAAQLDPNRVVASVNGDEIKAGEYYRRLEWYRLDPQASTTAFPAGFLTIKQIVTERLIMQIAKQRGVMPTQPEIDAAYQETVTDDPKLLAEVKNQNRTESELRYQVMYDLAQFKLRTAGVTITDQEVEAHFKSAPEEFTIPKKLKLRVIVVTDPTEKKVVDDELAAGKSFTDVAKAHSMDASKLSGGEYGEVPVTSFARATRTALETVKIGQTSGWIEGPSAEADAPRVKFLVEDIKPAEVQTLTPALRRQIRKKMMLNRGDVKNSVFKDLTAASVKAKVVISEPTFQRLYDELLGRIKSTSG